LQLDKFINKVNKMKKIFSIHRDVYKYNLKKKDSQINTIFGELFNY